jgi:ABC-type Fe3+-hydroxamate transport system substrate-binding protein
MSMQRILLMVAAFFTLAGCGDGVSTNAGNSGAAAVSTAKESSAGDGRLITHGDGSPIVVGDHAKVVIDGKAHYPVPEEVVSAPVSAETYGKNSPVVVGNGTSVTINYK